MTVSPGFTATEIREIVHEYQVQPHAHPERFRARPSTPTPAGTVGINLPNEKPQNKAA
ncbi:hypothetical protein [Microbacterium sp. KRD172]|uniref:hypothetical protein n=1 Tax=Microbacterium sp. KRD172 TaxID=2729727 RepID=UPI0019D036F6|nr:hypothetical protein [Microbacterium sp. KRD172]